MTTDASTPDTPTTQPVSSVAPQSYMLGLIGVDLSLSRTPEMHEVEGLAQGHPTVYRRIDTLTDRLKGHTLEGLLRTAIALGFDGLNITHPYKMEVIDLLDEVDESAAQIGSVNTVVIREGRTRGYNTDVSGYGRALQEQLPDVPKNAVVQVGAGGVGNAVAFALISAGVERLEIRDMDAARAAALASRVNGIIGRDVCVGGGLVGDTGTVEEAIAASDGVVNCTPLGMLSHPGTAFDTSCLTPDHWVSDVVYMPVDTQLLQEAAAIGCRTLDGTHMGVYQAVDAFKLFTDREADPKRMRATFTALGDERGDLFHNWLRA